MQESLHLSFSDEIDRHWLTAWDPLRLMMLRMVDVHRRSIDVRLQGGVVVRQGRELGQTHRGPRLCL